MLFILRKLHQTTTGSIPQPEQNRLFILRKLHQTTTNHVSTFEGLGCLSLENYIKPQRVDQALCPCRSCLSLENYIKPQPITSVRHTRHGCLSLENYIKPQPSPQKALFLGLLTGIFIVKTVISG